MANYIKTHKRGLYAELLMNETLNKHLAEIDRTATERINRIIKAMVEQDNTNEQLKETKIPYIFGEVKEIIDGKRKVSG